MIPKLRGSLLAPALAAALAASAARPAGAQLGAYSPQFPFAPAQAAPVGGSGAAGNTAQWLGADGGSMVLFPDNVTTFWAFGDSYIGPYGEQNRGVVAPQVVNTIALGLIQNNQFNPYYFYRGNYTYNSNYYPTNNPMAFFQDPLSPNANQVRYRFYVGKAIFYGGKLFVFLLRVDGQNNSAPTTTLVARVNNPYGANGSPNSPLTWQIDYLTLSEIPNPAFLAEAFYTSTDMVVYGVYNSDGTTPTRTIAVKITLNALMTGAAGSDISSSIQYLNTAGQWASTGNYGAPVGPIAQCWDVGIPTTGGFTVRLNSAKNMWQTLHVANLTPGNDNSWITIKQSSSPFGPWGNPQQLWRFPEMTPGNPLYNQAVTCYSPYEIPVFESNPTSTVKFTYSTTPCPPTSNPYYNSGNAQAYSNYDDNYYRVKVGPELANPLP